MKDFMVHRCVLFNGRLKIVISFSSCPDTRSKIHDLVARLHRGGEAAAAFERAIALAHTDAERRLLAARRRALA